MKNVSVNTGFNKVSVLSFFPLIIVGVLRELRTNCLVELILGEYFYRMVAFGITNCFKKTHEI